MNISIVLVIITLIVGTIGTLAVTTTSDESYKTATRQNTLRLAAIYILVIIGALTGLAWYITNY